MLSFRKDPGTLHNWLTPLANVSVIVCTEPEQSIIQNKVLSFRKNVCTLHNWLTPLANVSVIVCTESKQSVIENKMLSFRKNPCTLHNWLTPLASVPVIVCTEPEQSVWCWCAPGSDELFQHWRRYYQAVAQVQPDQSVYTHLQPEQVGQNT